MNSDDQEMPSNSPGADQSGIPGLIAHWRYLRASQVQAAAAAATALGFERGSRVISPAGIPSEEAVGTPRIAQYPGLLIQAAIVVEGAMTDEGRLIEAVAIPWFEIIKELERDPNFLHRLDWRKIEELICGAYKREGWPEVVLTPRSGDGGRDIIASKPGFGAIRIIDQVKAYSPGNKVPADAVRALIGVLEREQNVSKGVVTTTATFAPGIYNEWKAFIPNRLELKDGPLLTEWLKSLMPGRPR